MSKLVALRIPDELMARIEMRCSIRKASKTDVIIGAIQEVFERQDPAGSLPAASQRPTESWPNIENDPTIAPMCPYREYDTETGQTYGCRLRQHSPKIKHLRGEVIG